MRSPNRVPKIVSRHFMEAIIMIITQLVLLITIIGIRATSSTKCPVKIPATTAVHNDESPPSRLWYYEHEYDHQPAKLRLLTDADGAMPLRSRISPREKEITIVIATTRDRLTAVEATAIAWGGSLSLAVHVLQDSDILSLYTQLRHMHGRVEALGRCRLDIQVVQEDATRNQTEHLYPVNGMRNMAWRMATTELIVILDADFIPSPRMHEILTEEEMYKDLVKKATQERHVFVLPAFEFLRSSIRSTTGSVSHFSVQSLATFHRDRKQPSAFSMGFGIPGTKEELKQGWENGTIDCFHCSFSPAGHEPTNFRKFLDPATTTPYSIAYKENFEPYLLLARESTPMFDERFRGYGKNKMAHAYECARGHGMIFQTLPNVFIFEIPHPPSSSRKFWGRQVENDFRVTGLYRRFKSELNQHKLQREEEEAQKTSEEERLVNSNDHEQSQS